MLLARGERAVDSASCGRTEGVGSKAGVEKDGGMAVCNEKAGLSVYRQDFGVKVTSRHSTAAVPHVCAENGIARSGS